MRSPRGASTPRGSPFVHELLRHRVAQPRGAMTGSSRSPRCRSTPTRAWQTATCCCRTGRRFGDGYGPIVVATRRSPRGILRGRDGGHRRATRPRRTWRCGSGLPARRRRWSRSTASTTRWRRGGRGGSARSTRASSRTATTGCCAVVDLGPGGRARPVCRCLSAATSFGATSRSRSSGRLCRPCPARSVRPRRIGRGALSTRCATPAASTGTRAPDRFVGMYVNSWTQGYGGGRPPRRAAAARPRRTPRG